MERMADRTGTERTVTFADFVSRSFSPLAAVVSGLRDDPAADDEQVAALEGSLLFARMRMDQMTTALNSEYLLRVVRGIYAEQVPTAAVALKDMEDVSCK
ncbi:MAG: hypothetical protein M0P69_12040 [Bacteroidales bacterium]|nr:hypothetical protein [Bacteroidales bacterium]